MTDKQKIRAEIERRMKTCEEAFNTCPSTAFGSRIDSYKALLSFIDSLPEEPVSEDLEEEMIRWHKEHFGNKRDWEKTSGDYLTRKSQLDIARHFAEWKESQLMEDALNCSIIMHPNDRFANYSVSAYVPPLHPASTYISNGNKVKVIIIKED